MSHTIYAARFDQTIIHQHVHLRRESQSHAPAHVLMRLYPIDKSLVCFQSERRTSVRITIVPCDYLNLSLANEYVGDVTIPNQVIKYNQIFSRRISQSDCSIQIKLNYSDILTLQEYRTGATGELNTLLFKSVHTFTLQTCSCNN